jgi:hypothetical protein
MSNPLHILKTLDRHLALPADLILFGRSALALGYAQAPAYFHNTRMWTAYFPWIGYSHLLRRKIFGRPSSAPTLNWSQTAFT